MLPASLGWYAAPTHDNLSVLQGQRDAPLSNESQYAAPVTTGCNDNLSSQRDALPASKGRYDTAVTTAHENFKQWANDVLRMLGLTLNKNDLKTVFPHQTVEYPLDAQHECSQFTFTQDYLHHLASIVTPSSDLLNKFLQAAGSNRTFTYGASQFYNGKMFKEILSHEWPTQTIASGYHLRSPKVLHGRTTWSSEDQFLTRNQLHHNLTCA